MDPTLAGRTRAVGRDLHASGFRELRASEATTPLTHRSHTSVFPSRTTAANSLHGNHRELCHRAPAARALRSSDRHGHPRRRARARRASRGERCVQRLPSVLGGATRLAPPESLPDVEWWRRRASLLPPRPTGTGVAASGSVVLAVSRIDFGDTDSSGLPSGTAWQHLGLNIDGKVTSACSTDVCTQVPGSSLQVQVDGDDGIDNSFGSQLMPIIDTVDANFDTVATKLLRQCGETLLRELEGLGSSPDYATLGGALLHAVGHGGPALGWHRPARRRHGVAARRRRHPATRHDAWRVHDRPHMGERDRLGPSLPRPADHRCHKRLPAPGTVAARAHGRAHRGRRRVGQVGCAVRDHPRERRADVDGPLGARHVASLCTGSALASIEVQVEQAAVILSDGTNRPGAQCDGISVGLAFDAVREVKLGAPVTPPEFVDTCDGGS